MNILSLSCTNAVQSHLIPLYVLNQRYFRRMNNVNSFFLLPENLHEQYRKSGVSVLPINFSRFDGTDIKEITGEYSVDTIDDRYFRYKNIIDSALKWSNANVVIDDNEILSTLIADKNGLPRISIFRTGLFRSIDSSKRNAAHMHSMEKTNEGKGFDASVILNPNKKLSKLYQKYLKTTFLKNDIDYYTNYLNATVKLIPGIPSIERLPSDITDQDSYFYTGPLLVEDNPSDTLLQSLDGFFSRNINRRIALITTGVVDQDDIYEFTLYLLTRGYAVISTRRFEDVQLYEEQFFYNPFLSLNYVCERSDLIIHQCGSGIYHYPILHQKPTITIGTQCYDREDIALRLEEIGVSRHVPSPKDNIDYMKIFEDCVHAFEKETLCDYNALKNLKDEIYKTMLNFDMDEVLNYATNR